MTEPHAEYVPWWRVLERHRCPHPRQRCIHGDEIMAAGYKRAQCLCCGKFLAALPVICSVTGETHYGKPRLRHIDGSEGGSDV